MQGRGCAHYCHFIKYLYKVKLSCSEPYLIVLQCLCIDSLTIQDRTTDGTISGARSKLDHYRGYRGFEKPPRLDEKTLLENTYNTLQTRLRLANRPSFLPTEGRMIEDIDSAWRQLENYEKGFEVSKWK